jgi:SAM-dependent methyltransferase
MDESVARCPGWQEVVLSSETSMIREEDRDYFKSRQGKADAILADIQSNGQADVGCQHISVLEVGANSCFIAHRLKSIAEWDMHCLEIDPGRLLRYPGISRSFKSVLADATAIPFADGAFDLVICNHTLEHIVRYVDCIAEMIRVTKDGGYIYMAFPNSDRLVNELGVKYSVLRGNIAWYFVRLFRAHSVESRVTHHVGLADNQVRKALRPHKVMCLSKGHAVRSLGGKASVLAERVPSVIFNRFSPVGVYLVEKAAVTEGGEKKA